MKIGVLTTSFPRFEGDHSGAFVLTLARAWVRHGHQVRVLAPEPERQVTAPSWPGIEVRWIPYARPRALQTTFHRHGAPESLRSNPLAWFGAASFAASLSIATRRHLSDRDVLASHWCIPNGLIASTHASGRPHLSICHATDVRWLMRTPGSRCIARRIAAGATAMWFLTPGLRDRFFATASLDANSKAVHIGAMPVEAPMSLRGNRRQWREELGIDGLTALFMGRLVPVKGVDRLIAAMAELGGEWTLRVAGDGPERARLERLASRLAVDVKFEGWVRGNRKEKLFRTCDILVVPSSSHDGVPTVVFEALERGLPVVASRLEGLRSHVPESALVPPNDVGALAVAIRERAR